MVENKTTVNSTGSPPTDTLELEREAIELERSGKLQEAIDKYWQVINEGFSGSFPFERLRIIYAKQEKWKEAAEVCRKYAELDATYIGFNVKKQRMQEYARRYEARANKDTQVITSETVLAKAISGSTASLERKHTSIPEYRINKPFPSWAQGQVVFVDMPVPPFNMYFPSERFMSSPQKDFYDQWKSNWKQGRPIDVKGNISYLFVYTYGLIASIPSDPDEIIDELRLLQHVYKTESRFAQYLTFWIFNAYVMLSDYMTAIAYLESRGEKEKINSSDKLILSMKYKLGLPLKGEDIMNLTTSNSPIILINKDVITPWLDEIIEDFEQKNNLDLLALITERFAFLEKSDYHLFPGHPFFHPKIKLNIYNYSSLGDFNTVLNGWLRDAENKIRVQRNLPKIGEGWVSEALVLNLVNGVLSPLGYDVVHNSFPAFLQGLQLDIYIPALKLGIEYMGKQHYEPIDFFGGLQVYEKTKVRDEKKMKLCSENGVKLVYYRYDEPIDEQYLRSKIDKYTNGVL